MFALKPTILTLVSIVTRLAGARVRFEVEGGSTGATVDAGFVEARVGTSSTNQSESFFQLCRRFAHDERHCRVVDVTLQQVAADATTRRRNFAGRKPTDFCLQT